VHPPVFELFFELFDEGFWLSVVIIMVYEVVLDVGDVFGFVDEGFELGFDDVILLCFVDC